MPERLDPLYFLLHEVKFLVTCEPHQMSCTALDAHLRRLRFALDEYNASVHNETEAT